MDTNKDEFWIKNDLVATLINDQKLIKCNEPSEYIRLKECCITKLSASEAFMLTNCYKVKITLTNLLNLDGCDSVFRIVVKVCMHNIFCFD